MHLVHVMRQALQQHYRNVNITVFSSFICTKHYGNIRLPKHSHYHKSLQCDYLIK